MKILIIGGDSFIARKFVDKNMFYSYSLVSRETTGYKNEIVLDNFFTIEDSTFKNIDVVVNFAAIVHRPKEKDEELYQRINFKLPVFLAKKAKDSDVKHFIQMSTIAVYGDASSINIDTPEAPINSFGRSKLNADLELLKMHTDNFLVSSIRSPMVYGGGKAPGNMMKLVGSVQKGIFLPFKNINNLRDFLNVNNLIDCLNSILENRIEGVLLPTDKQAISTKDIVKTICEHSHVKCRLVHFPFLFSVILKGLRPIIYKKVFGSLNVECNIDEDLYSPRYSVSEGLLEMVIASEE